MEFIRGNYWIGYAGWSPCVKEFTCGKFTVVFRGKWSACWRYAWNHSKNRW